MRFPKPNNIVAEKYVAGMSLFKSKLAKIKLSANESALGPSPKAKKQYLEVSKNFARYPDSDGTFLRNTLANKFKIDKNRIILGSGSDQIFELICKSFLKRGDEVITPKFSFIIYRIYSRMNGAKVIYSKEDNFILANLLLNRLIPATYFSATMLFGLGNLIIINVLSKMFKFFYSSLSYIKLTSL